MSAYEIISYSILGSLIYQVLKSILLHHLATKRILKMSSAHDTLGVPSTATSEEIKAAYRRLAMKLHPDRGGTHEEFKALQEAYEHLQRPSVCPICEGKGKIRVKNGTASTVVNCPRCWG